MSKAHDPLLAAGRRASVVLKWLRRKDTGQLIQFLRERHRERFFEPINYIKNAPGNTQGFGFAVMALCSLLIETIQSYRDGLPTTHPGELRHLQRLKRVPVAYQLSDQLQVNGEDEFRRFFDMYRSDFPGMKGSTFYKKIRNELLHQGQTKGGWNLRKGDSVVLDHKTKSIYRDQFSERLELCFEKYLQELQTHSWSDPIWTNAARKIWWLVRLSR
jgi:hypothetical protein